MRCNQSSMEVTSVLWGLGVASCRGPFLHTLACRLSFFVVKGEALNLACVVFPFMMPGGLCFLGLFTLPKEAVDAGALGSFKNRQLMEMC